LAEAVRRLAAQIDEGVLLLDAPGVVRGVAGAELLCSLAHAGRIDLVAVLGREGEAPPLSQELAALTAEVVFVNASPTARRPGKGSRDRERTRLWDSYLADASEREVDLRGLRRIGTPPRLTPKAWLGKQIAFLEGEITVGMGEVIGMKEESLRLLMPPTDCLAPTLLVRDAMRDESGLLVTGKRFAESVVRYLPSSDLVPDSRLSPDNGIRPMVQTGRAAAVLMNGVFGDPQLHLRLSHQRRSLLFDLGDGARLPARVAHQVSDIFISHAHMDHISGFLWLLRSRIGETAVCRLYGPPGLAAHIAHLIEGIHWDRIGNRGPRFEIAELHGERLIRFALQAGLEGCRPLGETAVYEGVVLEESDFRIRTATLDHGIPVLAYAFEPAMQINVRKERLQQRGLEPGPWLTELKRLIFEQDLARSLTLPDGSTGHVAALAEELTLITPGGKLVYATDLADTPNNRARLTTLAKDAHTLFCEAPFLLEEAEQATRTGHLTTTACAEIANAARVGHLIPFHFSRRHEDKPWRVYDEIARRCPHLVLPPKHNGDNPE
jgi:ribonuclease BN (tRNA processing enzyme)